MSIEWPILAAATLPLFILLYRRSLRFEPAGRWAMRAAALLLWLALAGLQLRCDRPLRIVVMSDLSPSTRGATFRDEQAVRLRLANLLAGRPFELRYFADGLVAAPASGEISVDRTRLEAPDADAILLLSDGRFIAPAALPPTYPLIDPALDDQADARVESVELADGRARVTTVAPRAMTLTVNATRLDIPAGPFTSVTGVADDVAARLLSDDRWPENDAIDAPAPLTQRAEAWIVRTPAQLPLDPAAYLDPPAIAVDATLELDDPRQQRLVQYARDLGGTLVLVGSPQRYAPLLRPIAPLSATPPEPQGRWFVLLDASGSMAAVADETSRWHAALDAAHAALRALDARERVSLATFNQSLDALADEVTPQRAIEQLTALRARQPVGPTGLRAALEAIATSAPDVPTRLLVISDADADMGDARALVERLRSARIAAFLLATGSRPVPPALRELVDRSGGRLVAEADAREWARALQSLLSAARGDDTLPGATVHGIDELAGIAIDASRRYRAFVRSDAGVLSDAEPVIAGWRVGVGRVVSVAADVDDSAMAPLLARLASPPVDPRFSVEWDVKQQRVRVRAFDAARPMNALPLTLIRRNSLVEQSIFAQVAPGTYEAPLPRRAEATLVTIEWEGRVIARGAVPSRYAEEFDVIGDDRAALLDLASRTGGRVIEPGDGEPIAFARATELRDARAPIAGAGALLLGLAIILVRAPYLVDLLKRF